MKRSRSAFRSGQAVNTPEGEQGFWPSYTDMMSSVALILFFLMLIAYLQNLITGNQLISTKDLLADTEKNLAATLLQIDDAKAELGALALELEDAELAILSEKGLLCGESKKYKAISGKAFENIAVRLEGGSRPLLYGVRGIKNRRKLLLSGSGL